MDQGPVHFSYPPIWYSLGFHKSQNWIIYFVELIKYIILVKN